jgi:hypothetical protein
MFESWGPGTHIPCVVDHFVSFFVDLEEFYHVDVGHIVVCIHDTYLSFIEAKWRTDLSPRTEAPWRAQ